MVVEVGITVTDVPVNEPGFHEYEVAPDPVSVADTPLLLQIEVGVLEAVTVGFGFTMSATVLVLEHPALVPVKV
jgi:hypothetical protein